MAIVVASASLNDNEFLEAFTKCELPLSSFRHGDHLRLGWIYLHRHSFAQALVLVRTGVQRYAAHHGMSHIFTRQSQVPGCNCSQRTMNPLLNDSSRRTTGVSTANFFTGSGHRKP